MSVVAGTSGHNAP